MITPMFRPPLSAVLAMLLGVLMISGYARPALAAAPSNPPAAASASHRDIYRFRIGALDVVALRDGEIIAPNDGTTFGVGQSTAAVGALLAAAGQPTEALHLGIQPLLVHWHKRVLLFDTGAGDASFAHGGHLPAAMREAGVAPSQVTDIFLSHRHRDHIGGLLTHSGALAFPNATIHISLPEWKALEAERESVAIVAAIRPKVDTFAPGAAIIPGVVSAINIPGHTPGHSAFEIVSGGERLLYIGDVVHHYVISVQRPAWTVEYDEDASLAQTSRRAELTSLVESNERVYAGHFPFPGLGHVAKRGDGFVWEPEGP